MKFRFKPWGLDHFVEFNPGEEIICPGCGTIKPVPYGWRTHQTLVDCRNPGIHDWAIAMFDINSILGDFDTDAEAGSILASRISKGHLLEEDLRKWVELRSMWHIMALSSPPKWRIEPDPFWRTKIGKGVKG